MAPKILTFHEWLTAVRAYNAEEVRYLHNSRCGNRNHLVRDDQDRCVARIMAQQERAIYHRATREPRVA